MTPGEILARYDEQMRRDRAGSATQTVERGARVTRVLGHVPGAEFGAVMWSSLDAASADAAIEDEIRYFSAKGLAFEWKCFGHDEPSDLEARLARRGLRPSDRETLLCRPLPLTTSIAAPTGIAIRRLPPADVLPALAAFDVADGGSENEALMTELGAELSQEPDRVSVYVAWDGAKPVARAWIRFHPKREFADLWGGATLRAYRGRGLYRALVTARAAEAAARGARFVTTDALPTSRPILERLGFFPLTTTTPYLWVPLGS